MAKNTINVPTSAEFGALEARVTTSERKIAADEGKAAVQDTRLASVESQETNSASRITALESRAAKVDAALSLFGGAALDDAAPAAALLDAIEATDNSTDTALDIRIRLEVAMPNDTTRRSLLIAGLLSTVSYGALAKPHFMRGGKDADGGPVVVPTILSITLSHRAVNAGEPDGTVVGAITVHMSAGAFAGSLSLTGTDAADFDIVGSDLVTQGVLSDGARSLTIEATQGASSATLPVTIAVIPTPVVVVNTANTVVLTNKSGTPITDYPLQFGRAFVEGEIENYAEVVVNGTPALTQCDVKNRWDDDSVKFAVIALIVPSIPASGNVVLTFQDQADGNNTPITVADLLAQFPDFDATIQLTPVGGSAQTVSARQMLDDNNCIPWLSGSVAVVLLCYDRTASRVYDRGSVAWRSFHPEFMLTFWLPTDQVFVRYVGEVSNTQALEAFTGDVVLTTGLASPATVYTQAGVKHSIGTRWTRTAWVGGTPEPKVNIDHNVGYLADTRLIPNYDRSLRVPESVTAGAYAGWLTTDRKIGGAGYWTKNMPNTGYHPDIGPMPLWMNRVLMSGGDWRNREVMLGQADLAGAWPMQVRQGDPTKFADRAKTVPGLGLTLTVYGNPSLWLFDTRATPTAADALKPSGNVDPYSFSAWSRDGAHQPDPFTVPYLLTGDPFYLEGLQFWAGANSLNTNPGTGYIGRSGPYAFIYDQVRGEAWTLRTLTNAAVLTPDAGPLHGVFATMINDVLARWEGKYGINGTAYQNTPTWTIGRQFLGTIYDGFRGLGPSPLGWWSWDGYGPAQMNPAYFDMTVAATGQAPWMQDFMILALARADEMGFPTRRLLEFAGKHVIGRLIDPGYNPYLIGEYIIPDTKVNGTWLATWAETLTGWTPTLRALNIIEGYWPTVGQEIYWDVARGATGAVADKLPGGGDAWDKFGEIIAGTIQRTGKAPNWNLDPTWAIVPRVE